MNQVVISTTQTTPTSITINDLGGYSVSSGSVNIDLIAGGFSLEEITDSDDLQSALTAGTLTAVDEFNNSITNISNHFRILLAGVYDSDDDSIIDNLNLPSGSGGGEGIRIETRNPDNNDDSTIGTFVGQRWVNDSTNEIYMAVNVSSASAVWDLISSPEGLSQTDNGSIVIENAIVYGTSLSPPQITGNLDDYNPSGLNSTVLLRLDSNGNYNVTGLQAPSGSVAQQIFLVNTGTRRLTIKDNNGGSLPENRFLIGSDKTLQGNESISLIYDDVSLRWRSTGLSI